MNKPIDTNSSFGAKGITMSRLNARATYDIDLSPDSESLSAMKERLGLLGLKKVRFQGELAPSGKKDWRLSGAFGATVVQECGVTLDPVTTRIEESIERLYCANLDVPTEEEVEMDGDDSVEQLPDVLELGDVLEESIALALPAFPRSKDAPPLDHSIAAPGVTPLSDADMKPFAGLAGLRDKLSGKDT